MKKSLFQILLTFFLLVSYVHSVCQIETHSGTFTVRMNKGRPLFSSDGPGDTTKGKIFFNQMNRALFDAKTLRFVCSQVLEANQEGNKWKHEAKYSVWLKKGNLARVEIRDVMFPEDGTNIIYDGKRLWAFYVGENLTVALDKSTILEKEKKIYMTKDITHGSSLSHDIMDYGASVSMPVLYLSRFFGYRSALEEEKMTISYLGDDTVNDLSTHHIRVSMLDGQRIADYWISETDFLPRKMEENLVMNATANSRRTERWNNVAINDDIPDSLFNWKPPVNWSEYSRPAQSPMEDLPVGKKNSLYETFSNLSLLDGGKFNLRDYKGQMVLLVFWRLGCPPCRKEMPWLQQMFEKYKGKGLTIVGFNHVDNLTLVKQFTDKHGISYPNILDSSGRAKKIYEDFKTNSVPLNCLIDRNGTLIDHWYGFEADENKLAKFLETDL